MHQHLWVPGCHRSHRDDSQTCHKQQRTHCLQMGRLRLEWEKTRSQQASPLQERWIRGNYEFRHAIFPRRERKRFPYPSHWCSASICLCLVTRQCLRRSRSQYITPILRCWTGTINVTQRLPADRHRKESRHRDSVSHRQWRFVESGNSGPSPHRLVGYNCTLPPLDFIADFDGGTLSRRVRE